MGILAGNENGLENAKEPVILIAEDLAPSETVQMDKNMVLSFVTIKGSTNSHTAILARTMAIPSLVSTKMPLDDSFDGMIGIVDGNEGVIYVDPDKETFDYMKVKAAEEREKN